MQTNAIASLYTFALRKGHEQDYLSDAFREGLEGITSWHETYEFIQTYGSHYIAKARMGARFQENIYFDENASETEMSSAKEAANESAFSVSASGSYGGFSAEASYGQEKSGSSSESSSSSNSQSSSVSKGGMRQFGQIAASGKCGELLGEENILFPVEYETEPIYKLVDPKKYPKARAFLEHFLIILIKRGDECSKK